jgi:hypothetical protein
MALAAVGVAIGLTLANPHSPGVSADPAFGNVKPSPQSGFIIIGHKTSMQVGMTTCVNGSTSYTNPCRIGAYDMKVSFDPTKVTIISETAQSTGGNTLTTLRDTTKSWKVNQWVGARVTLIGGTGYFGPDGNPQSRIVASNTADTLTLATAWAGSPTPLPNQTTFYTLGGITDGNWLPSTGRIMSCPGGSTYGTNWARLACVTYDDLPAGPTGTGILVNLTVSADQKGLFTLGLLTPETRVLRVDGNLINADLINGTRRVILCPDPNNDNNVNVLDLNLIAVAFGATPPGPPYALAKDPDENGQINVIDLSITAGVFGKKCIQ